MRLQTTQRCFAGEVLEGSEEPGDARTLMADSLPRTFLGSAFAPFPPGLGDNLHHPGSSNISSFATSSCVFSDPPGSLCWL